jgi:hypothetical protein
MLRDHFKLTPSEYHSVLADLSRRKGLAGIYKRRGDFVIVVELPRQRSYEDLLIGGAAVGALASAGALVNKVVRDRQAAQSNHTPSSAFDAEDATFVDEPKDEQIKKLQAECDHLQRELRDIRHNEKNTDYDSSHKIQLLFMYYGRALKMLPVMDAALVHDPRPDTDINKIVQTLEDWKRNIAPHRGDTLIDNQVKQQIQEMHDRTMVLIDLMIGAAKSKGKTLSDVAQDFKTNVSDLNKPDYNLKKTLELTDVIKYLKHLINIKANKPLNI